MAMMKIMLRKYPRVAEAMVIRHQMYNHQMDEIDRREASGESLVIRPPQSLQIGHTEKNPDELERVYQIGIREAEKKLEDVQHFLAGGDMP